MAVNTAIGRSILLFPISWNLREVRQTGAIFETIPNICWCREVFPIVFTFIEMHLLAIYHRIGRFTGESRAAIEGTVEGRDLSVVVKETGRNGLQCPTTPEGVHEGGNFRAVSK